MCPLAFSSFPTMLTYPGRVLVHKWKEYLRVQGVNSLHILNAGVKGHIINTILKLMRERSNLLVLVT